jgi:hypothetical protein
MVTISPDSDLQPVTQTTGTTYTKAGFVPQTQRLLNNRASCSTAGAADDSPVGQEEPAAGEAQPDLDREVQQDDTPEVAATSLSAPPRSASADDTTECLLRVIPGQRVMAVDRGTYLGQDVLVTVVASAPNRAMVVDCSPPPPRVVYRIDMN